MHVNGSGFLPCMEDQAVMDYRPWAYAACDTMQGINDGQGAYSGHSKVQIAPRREGGASVAKDVGDVPFELQQAGLVRWVYEYASWQCSILEAIK